MIFIPLVTIFFIFTNYQKRNKKLFGPISFLIGVYLVMSFLAIVLHLSGKFPSVYDYALEPTLSPFMLLKDGKISTLIVENSSFLRFLENFLIIIGFGAILFFTPFFYNHLLSGDLQFSRMLISDMSGAFSRYGYINSLFSLGANLFMLAILLAFINYVNKGKNYKLRSILLIISSTSYIVYILAYLGRDGVIYWIMTFMFIFLFFKESINQRTVRKVRTIFIGLGVLASIPFFVISIARFGSETDGVFWSLLDYGGQQVRNFNDHYYVKAPLDEGRSLFPLFIKWLEYFGFEFSSLNKDIRFYYLDAGTDSATFTTLIGSFSKSFGYTKTFIILIIYSLIVYFTLRKPVKTGTITLSRLIIFSLLYQIVLWGVFYFRFYSVNLYFIFIILLSFALYVSSSKKNILIMKL
jgi:oligosaccharide repeat unit polymerase